MKLRFILLSFGLIILSSCASKKVNTSTTIPHLVSMIQLINNPEKYDGKLIGLKGYFVIAKEESVIYLSKSDYNNAITKNGIWMSISKEFLKSQEIEPPYKGYISIEGVFQKNENESNNLFSGKLTKITYISRIKTRDENVD